MFTILLAPILGWIGVALSGSNPANAVFGEVQLSVAKLLGAPPSALPVAELRRSRDRQAPIAPQTTSVGVSTTKYVRNEGVHTIRYNMGWTIVLLLYLIAIGCLFYFLAPDAMRL